MMNDGWMMNLMVIIEVNAVHEDGGDVASDDDDEWNAVPDDDGGDTVTDDGGGDTAPNDDGDDQPCVISV